MANFDDELRSKIESFDAGAKPSPAEIDRLSADLDAFAKSRFGLRHLIWLLLLLTFMGSQVWLIWSNRTLRKDLLNTTYHIEALHDSQNVKQHEWRKALAELKEANEAVILAHEQSQRTAFDSNAFIARYKLQNQQQEQKALEDILVRQIQQALITQPTAKTPATEEVASEDQPTHSRADRLTSDHNTSAQNTTPGRKRVKASQVDTVVIREQTILDSALFDSLYAEVKKLQRPKEEEAVSIVKTPLPFAWTTSLGFAPGYSNLYLIDGRIILDAHIVTGIEVNHRWALNTGVKMKWANVHEDITLSNSPLHQVSDLPQTVIENGTELEGSTMGIYLPLDVRYSMNLGGLQPYVRLGSEINFYGRDALKIEYGDEEYYYFDRISRKLMVSSVKLGLGNTSQLGDRWKLMYEGGYLMGNSNSDLVLSEKNGIYFQVRLGYNIMSR